MISSRKRTVLSLLVSFLIAPNMSHSEPNNSHIELFEPQKSRECYQETMMELGNIWSLCGPYRYKDKYMDRVRFVYLIFSGTGLIDDSDIIEIKDILSGKTIALLSPKDKKTKERAYLSLWDKIKEHAEESLKDIEEHEKTSSSKGQIKK